MYATSYGSTIELDQAVWGSPRFWDQVDAAIPGWGSDPTLERFKGFCANVRGCEPGLFTELPNGQQVLRQYEFPGLDDVERSPFPEPLYPKLEELVASLTETVGPIAREEFSGLLANKPLVADDGSGAEAEEEGDDSWNRAAWFGWQFLSLRGAKRWMPRTTKALVKACAQVHVGGGPAHRFVGVARQRANCVGTVHSDGRPYLLSTLTPLEVPGGCCGVTVVSPSVLGEETETTRPLEQDQPALCLDNTYPHFVHNSHLERDRFVLMTEVYHPALTAAEVNALRTLFACKDRFSVVSLGMAPWGFSDFELEAAISSGVVHDLSFWKDIAWEPTQPPTAIDPPSPASARRMTEKKGKPSKAKPKKGGAKGGSKGVSPSPKRGFGA